jgi:hypothetical protein
MIVVAGPLMARVIYHDHRNEPEAKIKPACNHLRAHNNSRVPTMRYGDGREGGQPGPASRGAARWRGAAAQLATLGSGSCTRWGSSNSSTFQTQPRGRRSVGRPNAQEMEMR